MHVIKPAYTATKRVTETYITQRHSRTARCSFGPLQKPLRNHRSYVRTNSLYDMVFLPATSGIA